MGTETLKAALLEVRQEKEALEKRLADLQAAADSISRILNGSTPPEPKPVELKSADRPEAAEPKVAAPRTVDGVRQILKENPRRGFASASLTRRMLTAGLLDPTLKQPQNTVLEAAKRLVASDPEIAKFRKSNRLFFVYRPKDEGGTKA